MINTAKKYLNAHQYLEAIEVLKTYLVENEPTEEAYQLLSECYTSTGLLSEALGTANAGLALNSDHTQLNRLADQSRELLQKIEYAITEITDGHHATDSIGFAKEQVSTLIKNRHYSLAIDLLRKLAEARKAKTTNILWIGNYLKDLYFHPEVEDLKGEFNKLLLDEILFYYLKACKLYEKGYNIVRQEIKKLND